MLKKQPACEPCRAQKLACDHAQPVCKRCVERDQSDSCTYRPRPFKRSAARRRRQCSLTASAAESTRGVVSSSQAERVHYAPEALQTQETETVAGNSNGRAGGNPEEPGWAPQPRYQQQHQYNGPVRYPNPGYLGTSSHTTLFDQVRLESLEPRPRHTMGSPLRQPIGPGPNPLLDSGSEVEPTVENDDIDAGARLIMELGRLPAPLTTYADLIQGWITKGANLAVAADLIECCIGATVASLSGFDKTHVSARAISQALFEQSRREIVTVASTTFDDYRRNLASPSARWETFGLFFTALCRVTTDLSYAESLYDNQHKRRKLQTLSLNFSDRCLDLALSLDCLNDFQLFLQYENFISHSQTDGDQSYRSWRKLGDVASSLYALGYHQETGTNNCPSFLQTLRQTAFSRAYSADKNVSIFLGRPMRILRKSCHPNNIVSLAGRVSTESAHVFAPTKGFDYVTDSRWFLICAVLKERISGLFDQDDAEITSREAKIIHDDIEAHWFSLPPSYRLDCDLKSCRRRPIERDFMVGAKLNYLHTHFLLRCTLFRQASEPDSQLLGVSVDMLALVIEAVMLKDQLVNSGTSLVWKVVYYGLAAAGCLCLALISRPIIPPILQDSAPKIFRDLSILVAEVEMGTLVYVEHPNYALLSRATKTIQSLISRLFAGSFTSTMAPVTTQQQQQSQDYQQPFVVPQIGSDITWDPWAGFNGQDFELNFWLDLAGHPFFAS